MSQSQFKKTFLLKSIPLQMLFIFLVFFSNKIQSQSLLKELNESNFYSEILKSRMGFVMFYSEDCPHCQAVSPIYEETFSTYREIMAKTENLTANEMLIKQKLQNLNFFKINSNNNNPLMDKYKLDFIPTIIWFNNEKDHFRIYDSETESSAYFFDFALKQLDYSVREINMETLMSMQNQQELEGDNVFLFVGDKEKQMPFYTILMDTAWNMNYKNIYYTNDDIIKSTFKISSNFDVVVFKVKNKRMSIEQFERLNLTEFDFAEDESKTPTVTSDSPFEIKRTKIQPPKKIENLIKLFSYDPINRFSHSNQKMISNGMTTLVVAHDYDLDTPEYEEFMRSMTNVAMRYRREIFFMFASKYSKMTQLFAESFRILRKNMPVLCLTSLTSQSGDGNIEKFRKTFDGKKITENDIVEFIEAWKQMKLTPFISSEDLPTSPTDENNIYKLVANNFSSVVEKPGRDVLLCLCSDRLEICEKFRERLIRIANKLKNTDKIIVAEVDPYSNEIHDFGLEGLPGIILLTDVANKIEENKDYRGRITTSEIFAWVKENAVNSDFEEFVLPLQLRKYLVCMYIRFDMLFYCWTMRASALVCIFVSRHALFS